MRALSFIFLLFATSLACSAQVYSAGVYSMGQTHEHDWSIGSGSVRFGFHQYRQSQDANGRNLHNFGDVTSKGVAWPRYTTVFLGPLRFTVRGPAWFAAWLVAAGFASVSLLIAQSVDAVRKHHTHAHNTA